MNILVTGAAGFIGYHLVKKIAENNYNVFCIDNINDYYDVELKYARLNALGFNCIKIKEPNIDDFIVSSVFPNIRFAKIDICDAERIYGLFSTEKFNIVIHIAAQAGVRFSLKNPHAYISSNIQGFLNILEAAKTNPPLHLLYASSSSVYGLNTKSPFSEADAVNQPANMYAVTKLTNELMAKTYSRLYSIPTTGLRFFTVYGTWGRPDMAPFIFTKSIIEGTPINVFNNGNMERDYTYIDDTVECIIRIMNRNPEKKDKDNTPAAVYNIGNGCPVQLIEFIHIIEEILGKKAILQNAPMQKGDITSTWADSTLLERDIGFKPSTLLSIGMEKFIDWYKTFYC